VGSGQVTFEAKGAAGAAVQVVDAGTGCGLWLFGWEKLGGWMLGYIWHFSFGYVGFWGW